ncbi:GDCCVxC domain-containing (seleno)protein [Piscinibacter sp.]|uniref:GDCCVxC domain-containing (seleno)protein n=1 Tax=Piscinibacter sp. TaxID=1903157 RepID=UPI00355A4E8C
MNEVIRQSTITCPVCGHAKQETMPVDACQWYYECESCKTLLRPKAGDCCVFCSFGTTPCPSMQHSSSCCAHPLRD